MKPSISVITLGVDDLEKAVAFYRDGLGFPTEGIVGQDIEHGAVAFFDLQNSLKLALWKREDIAFETGIEQGPPNPTEFTMGHNVGSIEEVDRVMQQARVAGATIVDTAHHTAWGGYSGHFQDLDGHVWEAVWNPAFAID